MATIYLFYCYRSVKYADAHPKEEEDSACHVWMDRRLKELEKFTKEMEQHNKEIKEKGNDDWSDSVVCSKELLVYDQALLETFKWADNENKSWQMIDGQADEEGAFKITVPRSGKYRALALGQAGFSKAVWETDDITVNPGLEVKVKLASPRTACLVMK